MNSDVRQPITKSIAWVIRTYDGLCPIKYVTALLWSLTDFDDKSVYSQWCGYRNCTVRVHSKRIADIQEV